MPNAAALAEAVRNACIRAALEAYEDAGISGLCGEGRWEIAIQAIRNLDLSKVISITQITESKSDDPGPS